MLRNNKKLAAIILIVFIDLLGFSLILGSMLVMAFCLLGWALAPSVGALLVVLAPTSLAGGLLTTLLSSTLTKSVDPSATGGILGLAAAIDSLTRGIAPALGGVILASLGTWAPGVFGAVLVTGLTVFVGKTIFNASAIQLQREPARASQPVNGIG